MRKEILQVILLSLAMLCFVQCGKDYTSSTSNSISRTETACVPLDSLYSIASEAYRRGDWQRAIEADVSGTALASHTADRRYSSLFQFNYGACQTWLGQTDEGLNRMRKAMGTLAMLTDSATVCLQPKLWHEMASAYIAANKPDSAILACLQREQAIDCAAASGLSDSLIDRQRGLNAIMLATLYDHTGREVEAQQALSRFMNTRYSQTIEGARGLLDYYNSSGQADAYIKTFELVQASLGADTLDERFRDEVEFLLNAYYWKDDLEGVAHAAGRAIALTEEISRRTLDSKSLEWQERYKVAEAQQAAEREREKNRTMFTQVLTISIALLCVIASLMYYGWKMRRRNLALTRQAIRANALEEMLSTRQTRRQSKPVESDEAVMERIDTWLNEDDHFLQKLNVRDVAVAIGLTQKRINEVMASQPEGHKLEDIVTHKRVTRACHLLQYETNYTIEAIALSAGFPSIRTFYRKFNDEIGLTPTEYRATLKDIQLNPPSSL